MEIEAIEKTLEIDFIHVDSTPSRHQAKQPLEANTLASIITDARVAVTFGEPTAVGSDNQGQVKVGGDFRCKPEGAIEQDLPGSRIEQIVATNDVCDARFGIINNDRKLVGGASIVLTNDEIAERGHLEMTLTGKLIGEIDDLFIHIKSNRRHSS